MLFNILMAVRVIKLLTGVKNIRDNVRQPCHSIEKVIEIFARVSDSVKCTKGGVSSLVSLFTFH